MRTSLIVAMLSFLAAVLGAAVPAPAQSLAELAAMELARRAAIKEPAKVITDKDLPSDKSAGTKAVPAKADERKAAATATQPGGLPKTDDDGHDEKWWQARAEPLWRRLDAATAKLQSARARVEQISTAMNRAGGRSRAAIEQRLQSATAEVERRTAEVADARRALEHLEEEARKAGALPGWLRK